MKFLSKLFGKSDKEKQEEAYNLAVKGNVLFEKEEYGKALKLYVEATQLTPNWEMLHYNIALVHHNTKNYKKAVSGFKHSLRLGSDNKDIYRQLANCYMQLENYLMAINNYKEHIRFNPDDVAVLSHLGACYHNIKNFKQSDKYYSEAILKAPNTSYFYRIYGESLNRRNEIERAFEMFKKAIGLSPNDYYSLEKLGNYYAIEEENYENAKMCYEKIPRIERTSDVHCILSAIYYNENDKISCINELEYSIKHYPKDIEIFYRYTSAKLHSQQMKGLVEEIQLFLKRNPEANKIVRILGFVYLEEKNVEKAHECAENLMVREPEDGHTFMLLGACFLTKQEVAKAKVEFTKSRDIFHERKDANCEAYAIKGIGCCCLIEGKNDKAFLLFQEGLNKLKDKDNYLKNLKKDIQKMDFSEKENAFLMIEQLRK